VFRGAAGRDSRDGSDDVDAGDSYEGGARGVRGRDGKEGRVFVRTKGRDGDVEEGRLRHFRFEGVALRDGESESFGGGGRNVEGVVLFFVQESGGGVHGESGEYSAGDREGGKVFAMRTNEADRERDTDRERENDIMGHISCFSSFLA